MILLFAAAMHLELDLGQVLLEYLVLGLQVLVVLDN